MMMVPVIIGITFIIFFILKLTPGDPAMIILGPEATAETIAQLHEEMGFNDPLIVQYGRYMANLLRGDFGRSYLTDMDIFSLIIERFPITFNLAIFSLLLAGLVAIPFGVISATKQYSFTDSFSMLLCLIGVSIPHFWLGLMLILAFSIHIPILPSGGIAAGYLSFILPSITLAAGAAGTIARQTRSSMLEVVRQDYIRTAMAKGARQNRVIIGHALQNAIMPVITVMGIAFGRNIGGAVVIEAVFSLPGTGSLLLQGIRSMDTPLVMGCVVFLAIMISLANLVVDIIYGFIDPRLKAMYK